MGDSDTKTGNIDVGEIGEAVKDPTRMKKIPILELQRFDQAAVKVEPAFADEGTGKVDGDGELRKYIEKNLIGEEGSEIRREWL